MKYEILYGNTFPLVKVKLERDEAIKAEMNAMISMSPKVELKGTLDGGILRGFGRLLSGEKFFFQELLASECQGEVLLAPNSVGDVQAVELDGSYTLLVQKNGFLAATMGIKVSTKIQNISKSLFSGEGFFILEVSGKGTVFISSFGAIHAISLSDHEEVVIDSQHLVAWPSYMNYKVEKASKGWFSTFTSGELAVCRFKGKGTVLIQTRNGKGFGSWVQQFIPRGN
ncbi:uncharacterized protein (TIGR00266 family) [Paenibacillus taihuensis]|uniref:Uncharacterized protein (TIGR00266 family) n=1 Tax=Paenibacillus taihuensis TaxID=1156355 RepID=A0A3D9RHE4_9BACL|nr:TIGR00266 family protein [Paenibacillus taihuensis]REE77738.1 uncharacterized protein (TIGR00266 family) [Paenibacillus taihuensis]